MKEEIYNFYVNNLSNKKLVFKYMKIRWGGFIIVSIISWIYSFVYFVSNQVKAGVIAFIPFAIYYLLINHWLKEILKNKYCIKPDGFMWFNSSYYNLRKNLLSKFLKNKNMHTEKKIKQLIEICHKEAEKKKYKGFVNWGILLTIFVPLWIQFLSAVFKIYAITLNDAIQVFLSVLGIIMFIFVAISAMMSMLNDVLNDFLNKESNRFKRLANMLEEILFEIDIAG